MFIYKGIDSGNRPSNCVTFSVVNFCRVKQYTLKNQCGTDKILPVFSGRAGYKHLKIHMFCP